MRVRIQSVKIGILLVGVAVALPVCAQGQATAPAASGGQGAAGDPVVATLGDRTVRLSDLEQYWREQDPASFMRMKQQVYDINRRVLDEMVGQYLLEAEAARRNVTVEELLAEETPGRIQPVTEARIRAVYDQSREREQGITFEALRPAIVQFLERQGPAEAQQQFVDELRRESDDLVVRLEAPRVPIQVMATDPVAGPATAPIEIVEFADFQCPYCQQVRPVIEQIVEKYGDRVKVVWKDFPLPSHPDARPAAEAAQCANDQGQFWPYHDKLFDNQNALSVVNLKSWAAELGMDAAEFNACLDGGTHRALVEADLQEGNSYGVSSTPTVYVNGRAIVGAVPFDTFDAVVREELAVLEN
jgi:protein-disulfide isomerase